MTILIPKKDLTRCFSVVENICDVYKQRILGSNHSVKSIDILVELAPDICGKPIDLLQSDISAEKELIKGYFVVTKDRYQVVLLNGLNHCWSRFVLCKELFHVFLDSEEFRSMDLDTHLSGLYTVEAENGEIGPVPALTSEKLAEYAAMEFLFPHQDRLVCIQNQHPSVEIAERYKIPLVLVEKYLQDINMAVLGKYQHPKTT